MLLKSVELTWRTEVKKVVELHCSLCLFLFISTAQGQISTPCSTNLISMFTPCLSSIAFRGSSSPTQQCCDLLRSLTDESMDCACLILTGNVPFSIPSSSNPLAIALPRACASSVPLQCKAAAISLPPSMPDGAPTPVSESNTPSDSPEPASPPKLESDGGANPRSTPVITPESSSTLCTIASRRIVVLLVGVMGLII